MTPGFVNYGLNGLSALVIHINLTYSLSTSLGAEIPHTNDSEAPWQQKP
jgi:hypothetical protein